MKVAIYARVSTNKQDCAMQLRDLREFVDQRKFKVFFEYVDSDEKGSSESRPQLDAMMDAARKRKFDAVLVWRFDRFARSTKHLALALDEFKTLGIQFLSYSEAIDTTTPMGQAMFTIISAMAQLERDIIRERVRSGLRAAKQNGKTLGRPIDRDDKAILKMRAKGASFRKIAIALGISVPKVQRAVKKAAEKGE